MVISISTANLYFIPFEKTLEIYKKAGFEYIELAGYWKGGEWEIAQHLKGMKPRDVIRLVRDYGLKISSFHDMGGVVEDGAESIVSDLTYEYLEHYDFPCLVFHAPCKKNSNADWWSEYKSKAIADLQQFTADRLVCIENLFEINGYYMSLVPPEELYEFVDNANIYVNADITHFPQAKTDLLHAADVLGDKIRTVHLSDFKDGKVHLFPGDGALDFKGFFDRVNLNKLHAVTIECSLMDKTKNEQATIERAKAARVFIENLQNNN